MQMIGKNCRAVCILLFLCALFTLQIAATDMDYEGELDKKTGEPIKKEEYTAADDRIAVSDGAFYNVRTRQYLYTVGDSEVGMNLPSGIVTTSGIELDIPEGMRTALYRSGEKTEFDPSAPITEEGLYVLVFEDNRDVSLKFTIVKELTGAISGYQMPAGFRLVQATFNDEPLESLSYVDMSRDGSYSVTCRCVKTDVTCTLNVRIDRTPPELALKAVVNGNADGPVDISDIEPGASIRIMLNGKEIGYSNVLTRSGSYVITVADSAGNARTYQFTIHVYFNFNSIIFFLMLAALLVGLGVYLYRVRKGLRVR